MAKIKRKDETVLLWSDETGDHRKDAKNKSKDIVEVAPSSLDLRIWLEKNKRGGKTVSVIKDLPHNPKYFQKLAKDLKKTCGSGGVFKDDTIEIQGDCREKMKSYLEKLGFKVKLAGG
jgi:translation initiation factor 1